MITKKDLRNMPFYQPFYGPAEAPPNVRWDIFWAHTCEACDLEPFGRLDWDIVSHPEGGGGYPEPEVDHEAQDQACEDGEQFPAGGYDDDDACLAALNEGFTLVRVPYGEPGEGWDRILVCARKDNPSPKYARDVTAKKLEYRAQAKPLDWRLDGMKSGRWADHHQNPPPRYDRLEGGELIEVKTTRAASFLGSLEVSIGDSLEAVQRADKLIAVHVVHTATRLATKAHMTDPSEDGPTIAIIEMTDQLKKDILRYRDQLKGMREAGDDVGYIAYTSGVCTFWLELEEDFTSSQLSEIEEDTLTLDPAFEPNPDCEASVADVRLIILESGFFWEADRTYDSGIVQSSLMAYGWLEQEKK